MPEALFQLLARPGADLLHHLAARADQDPLLPRAFDEDGGMDAQQARLLLEALHQHHGGVGQFLAREHNDLFADDFGGQETGRLVGQIIGREILRPLGQRRQNAFLQRLEAVGGNCRYGDDLGERVLLPVSIDQGQQRLLVRQQVDLVRQQEDGNGQLLDQRQRVLVAGREFARCIDHQQEQVAALQCLPHLGHHALVHARLGPVDSRRVQKDDLGVGPVHDPLDAVPRGLRLVGDDGDLGAHQRVQQRRFANIRPPENGNKPGNKPLLSAHSLAPAIDFTDSTETV